MVIEGLEVAADTTVRAGDLVGFAGGKLVPAQGAPVFYTPVRGVALTTGVAGDTVAMALKGEVSGLAGLPQRGGTVYLAEEAEGAISGTLPASGGSWAQKVGWTADGEAAGTATRVVLTLQDEGAEV